VEDINVKKALFAIAEEIRKIKDIPPISANLSQVTYAINKITDKL
jgi:hypothetical protein